MNPPTTRALWRVVLAIVLTLLAIGIPRHVPLARAAPTSNVAYVYDYAMGPYGVNDTYGIFESAVLGATPGPMFGSTATYNGVNFTNVLESTVDANGISALNGYDTVLLYELCNIGQHPAVMNAINTFLSNGGKVMIFDADSCAANLTPDYSTFLYPFKTSNPGAGNGTGSYTSIEPSSLTTGLSVGAQPGDSMGDANTFTTYNGAWCGAITGTSATNTGIVTAYAHTPAGGLIIYEGEDYRATSPSAPQKQLFDNMLSQQYNPDNLPCTHPASGITLSPAAATPLLGTSQSLTATVSDASTTPQSGVTVTFTVLSGPDAGQTGTGVTNASGQTTFNITNSTTLGTDVVQATYTDAGGTHTSNQAQITWTARATATATATRTATSTATATPTSTSTRTPTPTTTLVPSATATATVTRTPTSTATVTRTPSSTSTSTSTPTNTPVPSPTGTTTPSCSGSTTTVSSPSQYTLTQSDGSTWGDLDPTQLVATVTPCASGQLLLSGNSDLWTSSSGYNQDIGIWISGGEYGTDGQLAAWKESGGFAGTFSPNAAFVQTVLPVTAGTTYTLELVWKSNRSDPGTIWAGAGPIGSAFSPTRMTARFLPDGSSEGIDSASSTWQYTLTQSDGSTWEPIDDLYLQQTITPSTTSTVLLSGNSDLWTSSAGYNQDLGIWISGGTYGSGQVVAWKESGGFAGTFSPNAAFVQTVVSLQANTTYSVELVWKSNKPDPGTIWAGAGPIGSDYSPTTLTAEQIPSGSATGVSSAVSTQQYTLTNSDGSSWMPMDGSTLTRTITPRTAGTAILSGNSDLWTSSAGYNQDIGIWISGGTYGSGQVVAWKESGGFAGTFSPNAAFVQTVLPLQGNTTYTITLVWKSNKQDPGTIWAGAGPITSAFSPTRLTVELLP